MIARTLISELVVPLKPSDTGQKALNRMEIFRVSHLPVVEGTMLLGLVSDKMIYDLNVFDDPLSSCSTHFLPLSIRSDKHIYEAFLIISEFGLSVLPVIDLYDKYFGSINVYDLSQKFAGLMAVNEPGGVIVLEISPVDYSLSQIAQIVEGNDAKILSFYVSPLVGSTLMTVTLKVNVVDLSGIIQTFVRYDYNIVAVYMDDSNLTSVYEDRMGQLMKFMSF